MWFVVCLQGFAISLLVMTGTVEGTRDAKALQNLLICAEMVAGSFAMAYAYTNQVRRTLECGLPVSSPTVHRS